MTVENLTDLLYRAGAAHHEFEATTLNGVYDEHWPSWYARWVIDNGLNEMLSKAVEYEELSQLLHDLNEQHKQSDKSLNWAQFTALKLAEGRGLR